MIRALLIGLTIAGLVACGDSQPGNTVVDSPVDPPDELGSFAIGHLRFIPTDPERSNRGILVDLWYPVDVEDAQDAPLTRYPLSGPIGLDSEVAVDDLPVSGRADQAFLVFSHGYQGINFQSIELMEVLASHGFIVASIEHTGNAQASPTDSFDEAAANRVPDVSFLIDTMFDRNRDPSDAFFGRIDEGRVGVIGHSFGGMTAIGMAAGWAGAAPDPRVAAIVPISAVFDRELQSDAREGPNAGFTEMQLAGISVPVMLVGGTEDINVFPENNEIAFSQIVNAPMVYKVDIVGATHNHFANLCTFGDLLFELGVAQEDWPEAGAEDLIEPYNTTCTADVFPINEASRLQNLYAVSFFKVHLRDEGGYEQFLTTDFADTEPAIRFSAK